MIYKKKDIKIPAGLKVIVLGDPGYLNEPFCDREYVKVRFNSHEGYIPRESISENANL